MEFNVIQVPGSYTTYACRNLRLLLMPYLLYLTRNKDQPPPKEAKNTSK
jgi:hypothetical protein